MRNLILIGMPAAGKSTIGVVVAKRVGYDFVDTDLLIQKQEKMLLKDIIAEKGDAYFLEVENQVNRDLNVEGAVIAPGGSVIYCKEAMEHFKEMGTVVYLKASFETINHRIRSARERGVVLKDGKSFEDVYRERTELFEKYADVTICVDDMELGETIDHVLALFDE